MAELKTAPTPKQFADAWIKGFAHSVKGASGRDGRLSFSEARKMLEADPLMRAYADNALNYLQKTGQKSVSVEKLIGRAYEYAKDVAAHVAGGGGKVSLEEARDIPDDIRGEFFALRGRADPGAPAVSGAMLMDQLQRASVYDGRPVFYTSEGDYDVVPFELDFTDGTCLNDGPEVLKTFASVIDSYGDDVYERERWTSETRNARQTKEFLDDMTELTPGTGSDEFYERIAMGWRQLRPVIERNLTDVRLIKIGPNDRRGERPGLGIDEGFYIYALVGKTEDGKLAGYHFGTAET